MGHDVLPVQPMLLSPRLSVQGVLSRLPRYAVVALAVLLPISPALSEATVVIGCVGWVLRGISQRHWSVRSHLVGVLFLLLGCAGLLSMVNSVNLVASARGLWKVFKAFVVFLLASEEIQTQDHLRQVLLALLLGGAIASADGLLQWVLGADPIYHRSMSGQLAGLLRVAGPYHHPNGFGLFLTFILPISLVMIRAGSAWRLRWLGGIVALLAAGSLVLTFSRGAALGFLVAFLVMIIILRAWKWLAGFLVLSVIVLACLPPSIKTWVRAQPSGWAILVESEAPEESRPAIWRVAGHMISSHPWVGVGVNTFVLNYERYRTPADRFLNSPYAHNHYLQMLAEIGIVGFTVFLALLSLAALRAVQAYRSARNPMRAITLGLGLGLLAFLINGFTESALYYPRLALVFWFGFGMLFSASLDGGAKERAA